MSEIFKSIKDILTMREVVEHFGFKVNRSGFIFSPHNQEKTPSCKIYDKSYFDYSTAKGGDLIQFTASCLGVNNWKACKYLVEAFKLPFSLSGNTDSREAIEQRQREQKRQQEKERSYKTARIAEIKRLKQLERIYQNTLEKKLFSPLSEQQAYIVKELQMVSYKLDILCGLSGSRADIEQILTKEGYAL